MKDPILVLSVIPVSVITRTRWVVENLSLFLYFQELNLSVLPLILVLGIQLIVLGLLIFKFLIESVVSRNLFNSFQIKRRQFFQLLVLDYIFIVCTWNGLSHFLFLPYLLFHFHLVIASLYSNVWLLESLSFFIFLHSWVLFERKHSLIFLQNP